MHSFPTRINTVASVAFTALAACAGLMAAVTYANEMYLNPSSPTAQLVARPTQVVRMELGHPQLPHHTRPIERCIVWLDVEADFTPTFNWNTKQVYVYAVADYTTAGMKRNEVTLWDTIISSPEMAKLKLSRVADYYFDDFAQQLKGANVTVRLWYHIMSHSGFTFMREVGPAATSFIAQ